MKKNYVVIVIAFLIFYGAIGKATAQTGAGGISIISEGTDSKIERPFIFVARDAETYRQLQNFIPDLAAPDSINFQTTAIVAAFAGNKPTGGFDLDFRRLKSKIFVDQSFPPKDAMVTQMITQPYKVAAISLSENEDFAIVAGRNLMRGAANYTAGNAAFQYSGGIAGITRKFSARGSIAIWTYENLVTFFFDLRGTKRDKNRALIGFASGNFAGNKIKLARFDAGTFVENPHPPLTADGIKITKNGKDAQMIRLNFSSLPTRFADGFSGSGNLTAVRAR